MTLDLTPCSLHLILRLAKSVRQLGRVITQLLLRKQAACSEQRWRADQRPEYEYIGSELGLLQIEAVDLLPFAHLVTRHF
jgi:hypothetical protein